MKSRVEQKIFEPQGRTPVSGFFCCCLVCGKSHTFYIGPTLMNNGPISFPNWKQAFAESELDPNRQTAFAREIISFLRHCKLKHAPATVELIRQWLAFREKQSDGPAHLALRWFYREGWRKQAAPEAGAALKGNAGVPSHPERQRLDNGLSGTTRPALPAAGEPRPASPAATERRHGTTAGPTWGPRFRLRLRPQRTALA